MKIPYYYDLLRDFTINRDYFPIQFCPGNEPDAWMFYSKEDLGGKVVELIWNGKDWELDRIRDDKLELAKNGLFYGNDFRIAENIFHSSWNPLTFESLLSPGDIYFVSKKSDEWKHNTKFNNFVKSRLINTIANSARVIDLASGKGQDLFTYKSFGIKHGLFIDVDSEAIRELNLRKHMFNSKKYYAFGYSDDCMKVSSLVLDLRDMAMDNLVKIRDRMETANAIVMNLAIHYILDDPKKISNLFELVDGMLFSRGKFIFTTFNGQAVFDLLRTHNGDFLTDKFHIQAKYSVTKPSFDGGETIAVLHPFSAGELYEEPLVNIKHICQFFRDRGYAVSKNKSFNDYFDEFSSFRHDMYEKFTEDDKIYAGLYNYVILTKK